MSYRRLGNLRGANWGAKAHPVSRAGLDHLVCDGLGLHLGNSGLRWMGHNIPPMWRNLSLSWNILRTLGGVFNTVEIFFHNSSGQQCLECLLAAEWVEMLFVIFRTVLWEWASCQIRKIADCASAGIGIVSSATAGCDPVMHHGTCVTHVPWCMPRSLASGFLWSWRRGKRSRHSRRMRNPQVCVSGKRPIISWSTYWKLINKDTTWPAREAEILGFFVSSNSNLCFVSVSGVKYDKYMLPL